MNSPGRITGSKPSASGAIPTEDREFATGTVFETLSNRRRRFVLHYLMQVQESVTIRDLAEQIAAWENDVDRAAVTPKQRKRVYTALHQIHLPTMDRLGVVVHDRDRGTITTTEHIQEFDVYLDVVPRDDIPWSQFYLILGAVLTALITVAALGFPPFSYVGGFGYALLVALAVTAVGCVHMFHDRRTLMGNAVSPLDVEPPRELAGE